MGLQTYRPQKIWVPDSFVFVGMWKLDMICICLWSISWNLSIFCFWLSRWHSYIDHHLTHNNLVSKDGVQRDTGDSILPSINCFVHHGVTGIYPSAQSQSQCFLRNSKENTLDNKRTPIEIKMHVFGMWRKPEYPQKTHTDPGGTPHKKTPGST